MRKDNLNQKERFATEEPTHSKVTSPTQLEQMKRLTQRDGFILVILDYLELMGLSRLLIEKRIFSSYLKESM